MLDGFGLHKIVWNRADERFEGTLVASAADAEGRGISLEVRQDGEAADLTGATASLVWRHRVTRRHGSVDFDEVDASEGRFAVYYPAAMCEDEGTVDAQIVLSLDGDVRMSSRVFAIRVEPVLADDGGHGDCGLVAESPLSIDNGTISIDLSDYATRAWVESLLSSLEEMSF